MDQAQEVVQPVKKSGSNKTIFIVLAIAILLFLCFCCAMFMATMLFVTPNSTTKESEDNFFEEIERNTTAQKQDNLLDRYETANLEGLELRITDYETNYIPVSEYYNPDPEKRYVAIELNFVNNSNELKYYAENHFKLLDSDNNTFLLDVFGYEKEPTLSIGNLAAGEEVTGWLTYEVPVEEYDFTLLYTGYNANGSVEFSLK